jgi:DNA-binding transcriptional LysR family regulator
MHLPDFEALAVLAKVVEQRTFAGAAKDLGLSKATVSKAIGRLERRVGSQLFHRTTRRLTLTATGKALAERAALILAEAEEAEGEALSRSSEPRGPIRLTAPMSFGIRHVAPLIPEFLRRYPQIRIDLELNDARVDLVAEGYDAALRIAALPDSSLIARRLCGVTAYLLAAPDFLKTAGRPQHPMQLAERPCLGYAYSSTPDTWRFARRSGEIATVRPGGPLRVNNGEAMLPALIAGLGFGILPDFIAGEALAKKELEIVLPEWSLPASSLHWVTPPGGLRPRRVELLGDFFAERLRPVRRPD